MRNMLVALALASALIPFAPACASERSFGVAQMARDVTDAVRQQRKQQGRTGPAPRCPNTDGRKR